MEQTSVTVAMTVANWNTVMKALGELPFKDVADIIMIIKKTANVTPINKAENLPLSLVSNFKASLKMPNTVEPQSD